ncbi:MAG: hypothetical protein EGQ83_01500 [Holdemanella biformis]|nr:hypothetical protein [Holdemanella biformis]
MLKILSNPNFFTIYFVLCKKKDFYGLYHYFAQKNTPVYNDNSAKRLQTRTKYTFCTMFVQNIVLVFENHFTDNASVKRRDTR